MRASHPLVLVAVAALCVACTATGEQPAPPVVSVSPAPRHTGGTTPSAALNAQNLIERVTEARRRAHTLTMNAPWTLTLDSTQEVGALEIRSRYEGDRIDLVYRTFRADGTPVSEFRLVDGVLYQASTTRPGFYEQRDEQLADMFRSADPLVILEGFEGAIGSVEWTGETETVDGVGTRVYRVVIDRERVLAGLPLADRDVMDQAMPDRITYELAIDSQDLIRHLTADYPEPVDATISAPGQDNQVTAPDAAHVLTR